MPSEKEIEAATDAIEKHISQKQYIGGAYDLAKAALEAAEAMRDDWLPISELKKSGVYWLHWIDLDTKKEYVERRFLDDDICMAGKYKIENCEGLHFMEYRTPKPPVTK